MKLLIGSGWWCNEAEDRDNVYGDAFIRSSDFFELWHDSVKSQKFDLDIFVTDSASPIKPKHDFDDDRVCFVSLNENGGHAVNHKGFYCGWTRSVIMSMTYCMCGNYDYYVYVEQDALLQGDVIKQAIDEAESKGAVFGFSKQTAYQMQVSFFIVKQSLIREFLGKLYQIDKTDKEIAPENKFSLALSRVNFPPVSWLLAFNNTFTSKVFRVLNQIPLMRKFSYLSFGYGRERPIDFSNEPYYFQQATKEEISAYLQLRRENDSRY